MKFPSSLPRPAAVLFLILLFSAGALHGQAAFQTPADVIKSLPPDAAKVITRLGDLSNLPSGEWRYHEGDIAHGENPSLDDSSWAAVKPPAEGSTEAVWYRQWIEVPKTLSGYDLNGSRIWFQFRADANGPMPEIIYFNGRRVALGDDLEPIVLFDNAKPGDRVLVAVKLLATVDKKRFRGSPMKIDFSESRPNPEDERKEFISDAMLVPSLSTNVSADQATLLKAITSVDLSALDAADQNKFDASLRQAQSTLEALRPVMQRATLHLTGNSHIDAAWLWPVDRNGGRGQAHLLDRPAADERVPELHLYAIRRAVQRVDRKQISGR